MFPNRISLCSLAGLLSLSAFLFLVASPSVVAQEPDPATAARPTAVEAKAFVEEAEQKLNQAWVNASRAGWVQATYITDDTEILAAQAQEQAIGLTTELAQQATRFDGLELPYDVSRKLKLLKLALTMPAPSDPKLREEITRIQVGMEGEYGKGKYCLKDDPENCLGITAIGRLMAENHDEKQLREVWQGWRQVSVDMREPYARFVELSNQGARELGFKDTGALWRSKYDMPPDEFAQEVDRLWEQVRPLYLKLHAYVRKRLAQRYGENIVSRTGTIPAHLLGNPWAQEWGNIYDLVAPEHAEVGYDVTSLLKQKNVDERGMVRYGERFFTSLGFGPLPQTFWERSLFTKPRDREVVCHASAWDVDNEDDLRIKMCIQITGEDLTTIHHELGHNFYQRAYNQQPPLYRDSANDGFHEALGDAVALSVTPGYLKQIELLDQVPPADADIGLLLRDALDKIAFLPFGLLVDQWRWKVFSGKITPEHYNQAWWELREKYQGISPPVPRSEKDFDPGAKYHIPANVPYTRYFLARILQFQFHRAMCREAGYTGPLHRCSVYDNKEAGARLQKMMEMGQSRPWPEALEALTGSREMDASAIVDYFQPLIPWLDEQIKGEMLGWKTEAETEPPVSTTD